MTIDFVGWRDNCPRERILASGMGRLHLALEVQGSQLDDDAEVTEVPVRAQAIVRAQPTTIIRMRMPGWTGFNK